MTTNENVVPINSTVSARLAGSAHLEQILLSAEDIEVDSLNEREQSAIIAVGLRILESKIIRGPALTSPAMTREYLKLKLAGLEHEVFFVIFMDSQHQVIAMEALFSGSIDGASVYPREVIKRCLQLNAAALLFAHHHPSGIPEPSDADIRITKRLTQALGMIDVRVLDHVIVGNPRIVSLAERGLL